MPDAKPTPAEEAREIVAAFWTALYDRDWARLRTFFTAESIYYDVPTGPGAAARGPEGIEARLKLGLEPLAGYDHGTSQVVASDGLVITEHEEHWHWPTGERVTLPFVSVQHLADGKITLWRDYWDLATLMSGAPPDWQHTLASGDMSWLVDVTDEV
ncbi:limonene-1,2-epoxide hydrolase [Actinocorallia herbida]|uniref:Limonene-1,2-epoxide hydrolase n=1 Tax=Actinocorallia herbida TaxID=58109 RepID=A0A3N1CUJ2_9ACTN|nr:nuclear transport factor 2 family protein [Actinocorallia herbida]ROO84976.1 limonene-1,2-epoxide hydrolase [Actinocorallia herbida]